MRTGNPLLKDHHGRLAVAYERFYILVLDSLYYVSESEPQQSIARHADGLVDSFYRH